MRTVALKTLKPADPFRYPKGFTEAEGYWYGHLIFANSSRCRVVMYGQPRTVEFEEVGMGERARTRTMEVSGDYERNLPLDMAVESLADTDDTPVPQPAAEAIRRPTMTAAAATNPKAAGLIARYNHQQKQAKLAIQAGDEGKLEVAQTRIAALEAEADAAGIELPVYDDEPPTGAPAPDTTKTPVIEAAGKKGEAAKVEEAKAKAATAKAKGVEKGAAATKAPKAPKKPKSTHDCICGCGRETGGLYAPGHDARVKGILLQIEKGKLEKDAVPVGVMPFVKWAGKHGTEGFKLTAAPVKVPGRDDVENTTQKALEALDV